MKRTYFVMLGCALLLVPLYAFGAIELSEISYNPEGTDSGYEWVEILNAGNETISLEQYSFRESGVNHRFKTLQEGESFALTPNTYAIIADNPLKFQEHFPSFPGLVFDSSFSLVNTGELLQILDDSGSVSSEYLYNPELGGNGDGSTLGKIGTAFVATEPTPGRANSPFATTSSDDQSPAGSGTDSGGGDEEANENNESTSGNDSVAPKEPVSTRIVTTRDQPVLIDISTSAGQDRIVMRGVPYTFVGASTPNIKRGDYVWNFGDGESKKNDVAKHTYQYTGKYIASFTLSHESKNYTDTATITVIDPALSISIVDQESVAIGNDSIYPLEISGFSIKHASSTFVFPEHTFIQPASAVQIPSAILGMELNQSTAISLHGPDGKLFSEFNMISHIFNSQQLSISRNNKPTEPTEPIEQMENYVTSNDPIPRTVYIKVPVPTDSRPIESTMGESSETSNTSLQLTASLAEASEGSSISKSGISVFEILLVLFLTITTLLYAGYKYHLKSQIRDTHETE